ncbi:16S rRNA (cytidine(1402)-2'-O)-methyltransferase, partial [Cribrihabitans sp. XS_ASV171]
VAPGASAALAALTLAGLPTDAFFFAGFLPSAASARRSRLEELRVIPGTLIFYESPKRLAASLADMAEVLGPDRRAAMCRELTKKFEEVRRSTLTELAEEIAQEPIKGEVVVLVDRAGSETVSDSDIESALRDALADHSVKDAADLVARAFGLKRRTVYQRALAMGKD